MVKRKANPPAQGTPDSEGNDGKVEERELSARRVSPSGKGFVS